MSIRNYFKLLAAGLALNPMVGVSAVADVVPVVSARSAISSLTKNEIADIFLGKKLRLPDGQQAVPVDQEEGTQARLEFYRTYADKSPVQLKAHWAKVVFTGRGKPPRKVADGIAVRNLIATKPQAIGYIDRSQVDSSVKVLQALR